jgi:hypothetical protein
MLLAAFSGSTDTRSDVARIGAADRNGARITDDGAVDGLDREIVEGFGCSGPINLLQSHLSKAFGATVLRIGARIRTPAEEQGC